MKEDKGTENKENEISYLSIGIGLGMCMGVAIGTATDNLTFWRSIGLCLGAAIGFGLDAANRKKDDSENEEK